MNGEKQLTWGQLAAQLGVTRASLSEWRKLEGAPICRDVDVWQAFVDANNLGNASSGGQGLVGLREAKLATDIRLKELLIAEKERKTIRFEEVDKLLMTIAVRLKSHLYATFGSALPVEIAGKDAGFCRARLLAVADEMCDTMQSEVGKWREDATAP